MNLHPHIVCMYVGTLMPMLYQWDNVVKHIMLLLPTLLQNDYMGVSRNVILVYMKIGYCIQKKILSVCLVLHIISFSYFLPLCHSCRLLPYKIRQTIYFIWIDIGLILYCNRDSSILSKVTKLKFYIRSEDHGSEHLYRLHYTFSNTLINSDWC